MEMEVFVITMEQEDSSCSFLGTFNPEVYTDKGKAEKRHQELMNSRRPYSGYYFSLDIVIANKPQNDWS
jgi:hypothetical protein